MFRLCKPQAMIDANPITPSPRGVGVVDIINISITSTNNNIKS
jgi:hypothetical protein